MTYFLETFIYNTYNKATLSFNSMKEHTQMHTHIK